MTIIELRPAAQYDDPAEDYRDYWSHRGYEDHAERIAIRRMLHDRDFRHAVDVGGGYGRLSTLLEEYADRVTLADPSRRQLGFAALALQGHPRISMQVMRAEMLELADGCADLVSMIRVMHHLPDPSRAFAEISRVLEPGGIALVEVANRAHAANRLRYLMRGRRIPRDPVDLRSRANRDRGSIPFVNHHPARVEEALAAVGLVVERRLSLSNLRSARLKRLLPESAMIAAERRLQAVLAPISFGPSMLLLARKEAESAH